MGVFRNGLSVWAAVWICATAFAQPPGDESARITDADRAADDARQGLIDQVLATRLATDQTIAALLAPSAAGEQALRQAVITHHQLSPARSQPDGTIEIDAWISTTTLVDALRRIVTDHLSESQRSPVVLGDAALPAVAATGRLKPDARQFDDRPGWRHCEPDQVALAEAAAGADAIANLARQIALLQLERYQTVGHLLNRYPRLRDTLRQHLGSVSIGAPAFEATGVCRRAIRLSHKEAANLLALALADLGRYIRVDFSQIATQSGDAPLIAEGLAVAPPPAGGDATWAQDDVGLPEWVGQFRTAQAVGKAPVDTGDKNARRALAAKVARIEASRQLWMQIEALPLPTGETIGARMARDPKALAALAAVDGLMFPTAATTFDDEDAATVRVGIRLETVWQIVRDLEPGR